MLIAFFKSHDKEAQRDSLSRLRSHSQRERNNIDPLLSPKLKSHGLPVISLANKMFKKITLSHLSIPYNLTGILTCVYSLGFQVFE